METLNRKKCSVLENINQINGFLSELKNNDVINECQLNDIKKSLSDIYINLTKPLIVTLVGSFSSGKSTFINAIIQERILPERIMPCTGMVCKIGYCDSHLKIQYLENGQKIKKEINAEELKRYIDINDPAYFKREISDVIEIFHKNDFCEKDIVLVDTPGFNDPNFHDNATNLALEKADAVIYCMSAVHAYSNNDVEKINDLHQRGFDSIFYVVGFMDTLYLNDKNNGTNETDAFKKNLISNLAVHTSLHEDGIFFVSASDELNKVYKKPSLPEDNGIENVRIKIWDYLQKNRLPIKLERAYSNLNNIGLILDEQIKLLKNDKQISLDSLNEQIKLIQRNKEDAQRCYDLIHKIYSQYEKETYSFIESQFNAEIKGILDNIDKWVDEEFNFTAFSIIPGVNDDYLQKQLDVIQRKCEDRIHEGIEKRIVPYINTATNNLKKEIQHIIENYIIAVNIDNKKIDSSVSLHVVVKNSPLKPVITSLPLMATLVLLKDSAALATALAFNPIIAAIAALGIFGVFHRDRKKKIASCIKSQLKSYSLVSQYVKSIMCSIRWKDDVAIISSHFADVLKRCNDDIYKLNCRCKELEIIIKNITNIESQKSDIFNQL